MTINFRDHIPHAKTAWCPLFWSFVGREAAHLRCEPDQTWQKSLVLPMLGTFTRSISPPPDSRIEYSDMIMHELEQMRSDLNNERQYRAAMQLESARMQESKFSLSLSVFLFLSLSLSFLSWPNRSPLGPACASPAQRQTCRARPVWFAGRRERGRERERELKRSFWPRAPDRSTQCEFTSASVLVWSKRVSTGQLRNGFLGGCQPEVGGGGSYSGVGARDDVLVSDGCQSFVRSLVDRVTPETSRGPDRDHCRKAAEAISAATSAAAAAKAARAAIAASAAAAAAPPCAAEAPINLAI